MGVPGGTPEVQRGFRPGDRAVRGARAAVDRDHQALTVEGGNLRGEACGEPEAPAGDGGKGALGGQGGGGLAQTTDCFHTEDGWQAVCSVRPHARQGMPVAMEDVLREEADATGAEAHGGGGEAIDIFAMQAGGLQCFFGDAVGRCPVALRPQTSLTDRGLLGAFALATAWESGNPLLAQWCQAMSPLVS
jgi:hypothetical protein